MRESTRSEHNIEFSLEFYESKDEMFIDISKVMDILTKNEYQCAFKYEDCGVYVLEFGYNNEKFGSPMIHWLDSEQEECLYTSSYIGEDENDEE